MKYIIYISTASIYFKIDELENMLTGFRIQNHAKQITGLMLFGQGKFIQLIEGESETVNFLIKKIRTDKRHHSLIILSSGDITSRTFPDWVMGYKALSAKYMTEFDGFVNQLVTRVTEKTSIKEVNPVIETLVNFAKSV